MLFLFYPSNPEIRGSFGSRSFRHGRAKDFSGEFPVFHGGLVPTDGTDGTDL
jgi:hypothetical protein